MFVNRRMSGKIVVYWQSLRKVSLSSAFTLSVASLLNGLRTLLMKLFSSLLCRGTRRSYSMWLSLLRPKQDIQNEANALMGYRYLQSMTVQLETYREV
jgi:hypothetical protein